MSAHKPCGDLPAYLDRLILIRCPSTIQVSSNQRTPEADGFDIEGRGLVRLERRLDRKDRDGTVAASVAIQEILVMTLEFDVRPAGWNHGFQYSNHIINGNPYSTV